MAKQHRPPAHLSQTAKAWWRETQRGYTITDPPGLATLQLAAECLDRIASAREQLAAEGYSYQDRWGKPKVHPVAAVLRDAEASYRGAVRLLGLDPDPKAGRS